MPSRWQIYWVNQAKSRSNTDPKQPNDDTKPRRMFLIIGKNVINDKLTCVEIVSKVLTRKIRLTEVEVLCGSISCIQNDSVIVCHEIVTIPCRYLDNTSSGVLPLFYRTKVQAAIRTHLLD